MARRSSSAQFLPRAVRARLAERLARRRSEIEQTALARVHGISDPGDIADPAYVVGLRDAVKAGVEYGLSALRAPPDRSASGSAPVPVQLLHQARYAARLGISLDTVLRRYFAGFALLGDFIVQEANEELAIPASELRRALREEAVLFDRVVATVAEEYSREAEGCHRNAEESRAARVRMLLAGELVDGVDLDYELDAWHIGLIASGSEARATLKNLARALDRRLLSVLADTGTIWAWLGGGRRLAAGEALRLAGPGWPQDGALAVGEPGHGINGWRLSHRQAAAAMPVALRGAENVVAYVEVALFAAALNDELLACSLQSTYLAPLQRGRDGGATLRRTLHAYIAAGHNASAAAASLGVTRKTVGIRLRSAENLIGRPIDSCAAELETALRLHSAAIDRNAEP
ncbi:MAG TPA: helix-turn-helix domain-containing protein [Solirubrobacterales bacterium]|nr:helix-turn-helix domain-containing protein [Solirubrobacterales bacterium]